MSVSFDPAKRLRTLLERGLDFADAARVFEGRTLQLEDQRRNYGERRFVSVGRLRGRLVVIVWTPRGAVRHVISMRKANGREEARYAWRLEEGEAQDTPSHD
jgi:uncharacterized DUF497 family protein